MAKQGVSVIAGNEHETLRKHRGRCGMSVLTIFGSVILPIFVLIGIGTALDRCFQLDLRTLGKLNFHVFVPALLFIKIFEANTAGGTLMRVAIFTMVQMTILFTAAHLAMAYAPLRQSRTVLSLGAVFANAGNYGIPLCIVAFGDEYVGALAMVIVTQNIFAFTFGVWLFQEESGGVRHVLRAMAKIPALYAVAFALILKAMHLGLAEQVHQPLNLLADGLIPVALLTLGAQLSRSTIARKNLLPLSVVTLIRLGLAPLLAFALVPIFDFPPTLAALLIVVSGLPVAVNLFILAAEYEKDEDLASQAVFWTTLLSAGSVSILLALTL